MNVDQSFHKARLAPIKCPCLSNLTPSSLSIRSFQSQWETVERFFEPGLFFSPQNPPIVRFEAMILWHGMNGAKGLFARAVPTKVHQTSSEHRDSFGSRGDVLERGDPSPRASQIALYVVTFPAGICWIKS